MTEAIGSNRWVIPEGYIPVDQGNGNEGIVSHETACILNTSNEMASIQIMIYFSDQDPWGPYHLTVQPRRTKHVRFNDLVDPEPIPRATAYASVIESDIPVVVQHTRIDARSYDKALLSTMAYADN